MASPLEDPVALEKVLAWRSRGISYKAIAQGMGVTEAEAKRLGQMAAARAMLEVDDDETIRAMQLYRLDLIEGRLVQWLDAAETGDRLIPRAVDQVLRVEETRDRILGRVPPRLRAGQLSLEDALVEASDPEPEAPAEDEAFAELMTEGYVEMAQETAEETEEPVTAPAAPERGFTACEECGSRIGHLMGCSRGGGFAVPTGVAPFKEEDTPPPAQDEAGDEFAEAVQTVAAMLDGSLIEEEEGEGVEGAKVPKDELPSAISSAEDALF